MSMLSSTTGLTQTEANENEYLKHEHDYKIVLAYFFSYMAYIILEFLVLVLKRAKFGDQGDRMGEN